MAFNIQCNDGLQFSDGSGSIIVSYNDLSLDKIICESKQNEGSNAMIYIIHNTFMALYLTEMLCSDPPAVDNAKYEYSMDEFLVNHTVKYQCNEGYNMTGSGIISCSKRGTWIWTDQMTCTGK